MGRGLGELGETKEKQGRKEEREVFTGYFGSVAYSESLMQK